MAAASDGQLGRLPCATAISPGQLPMRFFHSCVVLCLLGAAGCAPQTTSDDGFEPPPEQPRPYDPSARAEYPPGPYGIEKGSVIEDYELIGFANPVRLPKELVTIRLSDFFNPTGDGVYPAGGPHPEGQPKPVALLIVMSAVWCTPCQFEAERTLPDKHQELAPRGEFLLVLAESAQHDVATESDLSGWTSKFETDFPAVLDPTHQLSQQFQSAFPANIILDTTTMTIVDKITGVAAEEGTFWSTFASVASQ
jgi:hypothetical protein